MSSLWEQRAARNEALFREVNENIARLDERHEAVGGPVFVCECADPECMQRFSIEPETYRRVREEPRWFLLVPGHEDLQIERVVESRPEYLIVEKTGAAGEVAEHTHD